MKKFINFCSMFGALSLGLLALGVVVLIAFSIMMAWLDFIKGLGLGEGVGFLIYMSPAILIVMGIVSYCYAADEDYHEEKKDDGSGTDSKSCCGSSS